MNEFVEACTCQTHLLQFIVWLALHGLLEARHCRLPALRVEGLRAIAEPKSTVRLVRDEHWCIFFLVTVFYVAPFSQVLGPMSQQAALGFTGIEAEGYHRSF